MAIKHFNQRELADRWSISPRTLGALALARSGTRIPEDRRPLHLPRRGDRELRGRSASAEHVRNHRHMAAEAVKW